MEPVWTEDFLVRSFLADAQGRLGLDALLALLQDAAWLHAESLGHGYEFVVRERAIWVLTRQRVAMESWPARGATVRISTWVRPSTGAVAHRDYEVSLDGRVVGAAASSWLLVDTGTRRPVRRSIADLAIPFRSDHRVAFDAGKIEVREDAADVRRHEVRWSDLDVNQHVNNARYAQWILDSMPVEWHRGAQVKGYEVSFLAETHAGDAIAIGRAEVPGGLHFQGRREGDGKVVFAARVGL